MYKKLVSLFFLIFFVTGIAVAEEQKFITIATGGSSGPYFTIGGAIAKLMKDKLGYNASVQSTGASVENINLLRTNRADIAFVMSDTLQFAVTGNESFKATGPVKNISAITGLYPNVVQIVSLKSKNIKTLQDLRGKRVSVGAPNSGVELNARMILNSVGITYNDMKVDYLSYAESVEQMKNGTVDAAFVTSGLPNATVIDLMNSREIQLVTITPKDMEQIRKKYPFFISYQIPAGIYKNPAPIHTAAVQNVLIVRNGMDENQVYKITKLIYENLDALKKAHSAMKDVNIIEDSKNLLVPLHPGAARYYKEALKK
jgi:TRAP transporter TAXI family solute receptor